MKILRTLALLLPIAMLFSCEKMKDRREHEEENEREIKTADLPEAVKNAINEQFSGAELLEADEITQKDGSFTYDVEIKHQGKEMEVMYDATGKYLGEEKDDDDKD